MLMMHVGLDMVQISSHGKGQFLREGGIWRRTITYIESMCKNAETIEPRW